MVIASSQLAKVNSAVERLKSAFPNGHITGYEADLATDDPEDRLEKLLTQATADGPLDHIIKTASKRSTKPISEIDAIYIRQVGQLPFVMPLLLAKLAPKFLKASHTSSLIFTTGSAAEKPMTGWAVSAAHANGQHGMVRSAALELKPLRVNVVVPGACRYRTLG